MKRAGHTHFTRGKKVLVRMKDGTKVIGKFVERARRHILLEGGVKVQNRDMKSASIYKETRISFQRHVDTGYEEQGWTWYLFGEPLSANPYAAKSLAGQSWEKGWLMAR